MAYGSSNRGLNALLKYTGAGLSIAMLAALPGVAHADENGISFWVPGFFGSLAATPQQPGWSLATDLLPYLRIGRRRRRACTRILARQGSGQPYRQRKSEFEHQRHRQSRLCDPDLCIRNAGARRPGVGVPGGSLWRRRHQPGGDLVRRDHGPVGQQRPLLAVRQHQRHDMGLWGCGPADSHCAGTPASTTT